MWLTPWLREDVEATGPHILLLEVESGNKISVESSLTTSIKIKTQPTLTHPFQEFHVCRDFIIHCVTAKTGNNLNAPLAGD